MRRTLLAVMLIALAPIAARADESRIFLSWHAPYGMPGATRNVMAACSDTMSQDTLFLTIEPGDSSSTFKGFMATLMFHAADGDSIGPFWKFGTTENPDGPTAIYEGDRRLPQPPPWPRGIGVHFESYDFTKSSGRLKLTYAVAKDVAVVAHQRYTVARVLMPHPNLPGCSKPMCIEWSVGTLGYGPGDEPEVNRGDRFVSWNSPNGSVCNPYSKGSKGPAPWTPPHSTSH